MYIDPQLLLFREIPADLREEMFSYARSIILGEIPHPVPSWAEMWFVAGGFDEGRRLVVFSTVFPGRVFLSLLMEGEFEALI